VRFPASLWAQSIRKPTEASTKLLIPLCGRQGSNPLVSSGLLSRSCERRPEDLDEKEFLNWDGISSVFCMYKRILLHALQQTRRKYGEPSSYGWETSFKCRLTLTNILRPELMCQFLEPFDGRWICCETTFIADFISTSIVVTVWTGLQWNISANETLGPEEWCLLGCYAVWLL
jgi:hypothetical protein